jgi:hypothetical protein
MIRSTSIDDLRPDVAANVKVAFKMCNDIGLPLGVDNTLRDQEYQTALYKQGKAPKTVTFHAHGLAIDVHFAISGHVYDTALYPKIAVIFKQIGFSWMWDIGHNEMIHFQWDAGQKFHNADILAGRLPPLMPLYKEAIQTQTSLAVKGTTENETKLIKAIQGAVGAVQDGVIGTQTLSDIACKMKAISEPLTLKIYGMPVIIAKDITVLASPGKGLSAIPNSMNGGFYIMQTKGGGVPCSICVTGEVVKRQYSCHYPLPESVLYRRTDGVFGITRVKSTDELPKVTWAVGGKGLLGNLNPSAEGFVGQFSDVDRDTDHAVLGVKNGYPYMALCKSMTGPEVNSFASKLGLEMAIMLDGGHIAGMNGSEPFAKVNTAITQYYVLQAI